MWDLICIGAGPAGATAARVAAEGGLSVLLVEKKAAPGEKYHCAGGILISLAEKLSCEEIIEKRICSLVWEVKGRKRGFSQKRPFGMMVRRCELDRLLTERAEKAGTKLITSSSVIGVKSGCVVIKDLRTGKIYSEKTRFIVFADGVNTIAYKTTGIGFVRDRKNSSFSLSYEIEYRDNPLREMYIYFRKEVPNGYYWIFPKKDVLDVGVGGINLKRPERLRDHLDQFLAENKMTQGRKIIRRKGGFIPGLLAGRFYTSSALVVGDAAGMVNTFAGSGILYAVETGEIAGTVIKEAIKFGRPLSLYRRRLLLMPDFWWLRTINFLYLFCHSLSSLLDEPLYHQGVRFIGPVFGWGQKIVWRIWRKKT